MKKKFIIEGMSCASCVALNESSLNELEWVNSVSINLATNEANVEFDSDIITFEDIKKTITWNWFKVNEDTNSINKIEVDNRILKRFLLSLIFSIPVFSMMFIDTKTGIEFLWIDISMIIFALLSWIVVCIFWSHFHRNAFTSLLRLNFNMDSLVSLWTLTAFIYSLVAINYEWVPVYFEAAVSIITLINLWKYLEHKAKTKAGDAISKLLELWAKQASVLVNWKIIHKDIDDVVVGDILLVNAWEKIPLDWTIISWSANIDESMLTWESIPVFKEVWGECFWWAINIDGSIELKVAKNNSEWTLSNIIALVNEAQTSKAPIQKLADTVSWVFVPVIIVISIITFISWYIITWNISLSIIAGVATLVIACPCALWLATPTAIMVWTWVWASKWILIKNAETLEKTKDIHCVVFDKTWTLTNGKPIVTDEISIGGNEEFIKYARSLSVLSNHPLSKAIYDYKSEVNVSKVTNFEEIKWKGTQWKIWKDLISLWNINMFNKKNISKEISNQIDALSLKWKTPVLVWKNNEIVWILSLLDTPKKWVENTIKKLHLMNIEVIMLTWDTKNTASFIASSIWIDKVFSEVLPEEKLDVIKSLQSEWKKVAFVWDWINDAPALVQSDLSIAMWTGSDIAIESSDIVLVKWNLQKVVDAINLSRKTLTIIKQNLFWAFIYNSIWIPLAAFGILNPIFASFAMSMSSVSVVSNSLRLKLFKGS